MKTLLLSGQMGGFAWAQQGRLPQSAPAATVGPIPDEHDSLRDISARSCLNWP